jgi:drug/metabolite transporter (DMT)-like permease
VSAAATSARPQAGRSGMPRSRRYTITLGLAFFANYVLYGANYLAITESVRHGIPTVTGGGARFAFAGVVVLGVLLCRGRSVALNRQTLRATLLSGVLVLGVFGPVAVAAKEVSSGITALLLACVPMIVVGLRIGVDRERVRTVVIASVVAGFVGVATVLISSGGGTSSSPVGLALIIASAIGLATGTFLIPKLSLPTDTMVSAGWQLLWGGLLLLVIGALLGEWADFHPAAVPVKAWLAYAYLASLGTFACFIAFVWLLGQVPVSQVAAAGYLNPIVAVVLGWALAGEQLGVPELLGGAVIVISVAFVITRDRPRVVEVVPPGLGPAGQPVDDSRDGAPVLAPASGHQVVKGQRVD